MINGKQCTIAWYVDDNKVSHVSDEVLTEVIDEVKKHFGELLVSRGKEHTFLGMNLKFKDDGTVHLRMKGYIEEAIVLRPSYCLVKMYPKRSKTLRQRSYLPSVKCQRHSL